MSNRRHISLSVKLQSALLAAGFEPDDEIQWDHEPALQFRKYDPMTGLYDPDELDPRYLRPMRKADHAAKTGSRKGRAHNKGSDANLAKNARKRNSTKPKRKIPTRPLMRASMEDQT